MRKQPQKKSIGQLYWREFENLAIRLINDQYDIRPDVVIVTPPSKDGGYDGYISHRLTKKDSFFELRNIALVESKLRSEKTSLELVEILAPMVIAFNMAANSLIIVTNKHFSYHAKLHKERFKDKTNLSIEFVDGYKVKKWVKKNYDSLKDSFNVEFLEFLLLNEKVRNERILADQQISGDSKPTYIERHDFVRNKNSFKPFGSRRLQLMNDLTKCVMSQPGITIVEGTAGVGKSVIIENVLAKLQRNSFNISVIDLQKCETGRVLFLRILESFWGIDSSIVIDSKIVQKNLDLLIGYAGGEKVSKEMKKAVYAVLRDSINEYNSQKDLYQHLLVQFLTKLITPHSKNNRPLIVFQNLNRTYPETLDFLYAVSNSLKDVGVRICIELRDSGHMEEIIDQSEWAKYVKRFRSIQTLGIFKIDIFNDNEAFEYLQELLPGLGEDRIQVILQKVGTLPLFLYSASQWLKQSAILSNTSFKHYVIEDIERFFVDISPSNCIAIVDHLIRIWSSNIKWPYEECITASVLLEGQVNIDSLRYIAPKINSIKFADQLTRTGLFKHEFNNINVLHDLMFERMQHIYKDSAILSRVANQLIPNLHDIIKDPQKRKLKEIELNFLIGNWSAITRSSYETARELYKTNQFELSTKFFEIGYKTSHQLSNAKSKTIAKIKCLTEWLNTETILYRIGNKENKKRLDELIHLLFFSPMFSQKAYFQFRTMLFQWHSYFKSAEYEKSFEVTEQIMKFIHENKNHLDEDYYGQGYCARALSIKELGNYNASLEIFKKGLNRYPKSISIYAGYLSHKASMALKHSPHQSLLYYKKLLEATKGANYSFLEIIHTRVDIAMAEFLSNHYENSLNAAIYAFSVAQANGIQAEEGRALNIIGCVRWVHNQFEIAAKVFDKSAFALESSLSYTYLWRVRTNLAGIYIDLSENEKAKVTIEAAIHDILKYNMSELKNISHKKNFSSSRLYVALLALSQYLNRINAINKLKLLIEEVPIKEFRSHVRDLINNKFSDKVFYQTSHIHNGRIMITG